ncbi:E3 ubiquitin-protein ligase XIAP isoform X3, partial [Biomphalaria glabrata]
IWLNPESLSVATEHNSPSSSKEMKDELKDEVKDELKDELTLTPGDTQSSHVDTNEDHMGIHPECKICLMRDACVAFVPCGHLVSCPECAEGLDKCPICRSEIKQWLRTFIQ